MAVRSWRALVAGWTCIAGATALAPPALAVVRPDLSSSGFVLVAPSQPRPQEPFRLSFSYPGTAAGYSATPQVQLGDANVDVFLADPCVEAGANCGSRRVMALSVDVPGVDLGNYVVRVFAGRDTSSALVQVGGVNIVPSSSTRTQPVPAEGYWAGPEQPGSGFYLDRQGPVWAVGLFNYLPPISFDLPTTPSWQLAVGELKRDGMLLQVNHYASGSCYGCPGYAPPAAPASLGILRLRTESARRGWLTVNGGVELPVVSIPFGANYIDADLIDAGNPVFGPLLLPDIRGEWLLADDLGSSLRLTFDTAPDVVESTAPGAIIVRFRGKATNPQVAEVVLSCQHGNVASVGIGLSARPAMCALTGGPSTGLVTSVPLAEFELANIEESRMQGRLVRVDNIVAGVIAHRIAPAQAEVQP